MPRTVLTLLFSFKPTKIRSFTIKTRVKQVLGVSQGTDCLKAEAFCTLEASSSNENASSL